MSMRESVGRTWPSIYGDRRVVGEALVGGQLHLKAMATRLAQGDHA